jgi:hypothetical protein
MNRAVALLLAACGAAFCAVTPALAQQATPDYAPVSGQTGKDVVWVPTPQAVVDKMLDMARVGPGDTVMDLGSGDGRADISAAKRGATARGVEYNADLVELSRRNAAREGVSARATFVNADLFKADLSSASVILMFLLPELNLRLRPRILALKAGTRIVSNSFNMGDWRPDEIGGVTGEGCDNNWCTALLWIVPARVAGTYRLARGEVTLEQRYQTLTGSLRIDGTSHALKGRVHGEEIRFTAEGKPYRGRLSGGRLELF